MKRATDALSIASRFGSSVSSRLETSAGATRAVVEWRVPHATSRSCEGVLHDYRDPERSVVAVASAVTWRVLGDAMSEIGGPRRRRTGAGRRVGGVPGRREHGRRGCLNAPAHLRPRGGLR
ncbi:PAS domain-containing protein [Lentzea sp. NPDC005914]|uniref:PAS domain-containing protein n=1 Tax=Lentzea sp. NPDC005914 TaxID=3154572 RepID=UPI0033FBC4D2